MAEIIVKKALRDLAKKLKVRIAGDVAKELNKKVEAMLKEAAARAKANRRETIKPYDL